MKLDEHRYIDKDKTMLRTANSLYDNALEIIGELSNSSNKQLIDKKVEYYRLAYSSLQESLAFGKGEAAAGIAYLYRTGSGVQKNEYKDKLFTSIGNKLGDKTCKKMVSQGDYTKVETEANNWVKTIKEIEKKYPNKDAEITYEMTVEVRSIMEKISKESKEILKECNLLNDVDHSLKTAHDLYEYVQKELQPIKNDINKGNFSPEIERSLQKLLPSAMLSLMYGETEILDLITVIYARVKKYKNDSDINYNYHLLCAIREKLNMRPQKDYKKSEISGKDKLKIDEKAQEVVTYIKKYKGKEDIKIDKDMVIEAGKVLKCFHNDSIMKDDFSDLGITDFNQHTPSSYVHLPQLSYHLDEHSQYDDHHEVQTLGVKSKCYTIF
ncbi:MAG: hypothetical protein LN588_02355 [Rickettsia endosymbiont of Bryobia graminum]|nr:hypothetical protein [Rickettsia endosymbiont of Bryobia graminum]